MTRFEDLNYLVSSEHYKDCYCFANFLAGELAKYLGCDRNQVGFVSERLPMSAPSEVLFSDPQKFHRGFLYATIAINLPNEIYRGSNMRADIRLRKVQDNFLVQIRYKIHEPHYLRRENTEALRAFCKSLFDEFISTEYWGALPSQL